MDDIKSLGNDALSREAIIYAYNFILGRNPESNEVIIYWQNKAKSCTELRKLLFHSREFQKKLELLKQSWVESKYPKAELYFDYFPLDERIKAVAQGGLYEIANSKMFPRYRVSDLNLENLNYRFNRFSVRINEILYQCMMSTSTFKHLYVLLTSNGGMGSEKRANKAKFERCSWCEYLDGICLNIEDPMAVRYPKIKWGGYFGDENNFYVIGVAILVKKIAILYNIPFTEITFLGISSAGFASLHLTSLIQGSHCVVENPQIYLENYFNFFSFNQVTGYDINDNKYNNRRDVEKAVINNNNSDFHIFFNRSSTNDFEKQCRPFLLKLGIKDFLKNYYKIDNLNIYILDTPITLMGDTHSNWLDPFYVFMAERLSMFDDSEIPFIVNMYIKANREKHMNDKS